MTAATGFTVTHGNYTVDDLIAEVQAQMNTDAILINACQSGNLELVQSLINEHNVNTIDTYGFTPLIQASGYGHLDIVKFLLNNGADINSGRVWYPSSRASVNGQLDIVKFFINNNFRDVNFRYSYGDSLLEYASRGGHLDIVKFLLKNGAYVNTTNNSGWTPFMVASCRGHLDVIKFLFDNGADINARGGSGNHSSLFWEFHHKRGRYLDVVKFLLKKDITEIFDAAYEIPILFLTENIHFIISLFNKSQIDLYKLRDLLSFNIEEKLPLIDNLTMNYGIEPSIFSNIYNIKKIENIKNLVKDKKQSLDDALKEHNIPKDLTNKINEYLYYN